jgi:trk system potassium uptake protein
MNHRIVARILGVLLLLEAAAMLACGLFARFDVVAGDEEAAAALLRCTLWTSLAGGGLVLAGGWRLPLRTLPRREAVLVVGLGWLFCSAFGALPYWLGPPGLELAAACFEAASGFTTTGASVIADPDAWPRGMLLWRATTNWLGGIGILVLFVAVLSYLGVGSKSLFQNESSFRSGEAGLARIQDTALSLLRIYLGFTLTAALGLRLLGLTWYNAVCHAMAAVSTGGFSPHTASVGHYSPWRTGWLIEGWLSLIMLLCSLNFLLYVVWMRRNYRRLRQEEDARWFVVILVFVSLAIATGRAAGGEAAFGVALRESWFTVVSLASTCGFGTADYIQWPAWCQALLGLLMLMGGCAGSTSGGFKVGRLLVFAKFSVQEITRTFRPNQVFRLQHNGSPVERPECPRAVVFLALYAALLAFSAVVVCVLEAGSGISLETATGAAISALSNIGPGFGAVGPTAHFGGFRDATQIFLAWIMIVGRLELFAILVLLVPSAWRKF